MKTSVLVLFSIFCLAVLGVLFSIGHTISVEERQHQQQETEWMQFSKINHCKVIKGDSFWSAETTWECDGGFQVIRRP